MAQIDNPPRKPFVTRGANVKRCEQCRLPVTACICEYRSEAESQVEFVVLMHRYETYKPTNTGRLTPIAKPDNVDVATAKGAKLKSLFKLLLALSGICGWLRLVIVLGSKAQQLKIADKEINVRMASGLKRKSCCASAMAPRFTTMYTAKICTRSSFCARVFSQLSITVIRVTNAMP